MRLALLVRICWLGVRHEVRFACSTRAVHRARRALDDQHPRAVHYLVTLSERHLEKAQQLRLRQHELQQRLESRS